MQTKAYAAYSCQDDLKPFSLQRRTVGEHDVKIDILYCGVCHSDLHQVHDDWGGSIYPMVPGHEIVGKVVEVGAQVKKFKVGDTAGIGCFVDSCRSCPQCQIGLEQYCDQGMTGTYNAMERDGKTPTFGGYSTEIVCDENYTLKVSDNLPLEGVAPLLCAGITTYSPLRHWKVGPGQKVGILGLGGLGHMGVKLAASLGAEVTMLSGSPAKKEDAKRLGAHHFALTSDLESMKKLKGHFDFILDTVSAAHDCNVYLELLKVNGVLVLVGLPNEPLKPEPFSLVAKRHTLAGSMIGGIAETQEMLDYCAEHNLVSDVEVIPIQEINEAYTRLQKGDVKYRFVIDMASLKNS